MPTTALLPLNPTASPQQITRILPIRANLLPPEIVAGRAARRMRLFVIVAVVIVVVGIGAWYADAFRDEKQTIRDRDAVIGQVDGARALQDTDAYRQVTTTIQANKAYRAQLKTLMANDLPWSVVLDDLRSTATARQITIGSITAAAAEKQGSSAGSLPTSGTASTMFAVTISGTAKDKKSIASYITGLAKVHGVANPYLTTATNEASSMSFTINVAVTSTALCGRFSATTCKTGGN